MGSDTRAITWHLRVAFGPGREGLPVLLEISTSESLFIILLLRLSGFFFLFFFPPFQSDSLSSGSFPWLQGTPYIQEIIVQFSSVASCDQLFATPWTAACQASLSITNS